jgi:hypothetical protein
MVNGPGLSHDERAMAERASKGDNDPAWIPAVTSSSQSSAPTMTDAKPPAIPLQVVKAWWYRMLQSAGPPV